MIANHDCHDPAYPFAERKGARGMPHVIPKRNEESPPFAKRKGTRRMLIPPFAILCYNSFALDRLHVRMMINGAQMCRKTRSSSRR